MRSEELAALAGDIRPVDLGAVHNRARDEVVSKGKATGKEHGVAVLGDGTTVSFGGDRENQLSVPRFAAPTGSVVVRHNHSIGDSLSRADLFMLLNRAELGRVDAHGHAGLWASAQRTGGAVSSMSAMALIHDAASRADRLIHDTLGRGRIEPRATQAGLRQVVTALLLEQVGVIRYALNTDSVLAMARSIIQWGR